MKNFIVDRRKTNIDLKNLHNLEYIKKLIKNSGYFDAEYYSKSNPDVIELGHDPLEHFILYGGREGRNPSEKFNLRSYLQKNALARELDINPLVYGLLFDEIGMRHTASVRHSTKKKINTNKKRVCIDIINVNFYDATGKILYKGGAERYIYNLAQLLKGWGYYPRIIQNAKVDFEKNYGGISVIGVNTGEAGTNSSALRKMSRKFRDKCKDTDLIIASPLDLACEITDIPTIGINHGIHWDSVKKSLYNNRSSDYREIFDALENISTGVCVDTNFINWTRTYDYELGEKLRYIPNYYDSTVFKPELKKFNKELNIVYPRRLYDARGIYLTLDAFEKILQRHKDVNLSLVGQTDDNLVTAAVDGLIKKFPKQVSLTEYDMEDMHLAYKNSHIILIPTRYSEGTSLSCIEAMATNNAVIATNIGGLPNLVIDEYNGLLIDPSARALETAVERLIDDRSLLEQIATNACEVARVFDKNKWDKLWEQIIKEVIL